MPQSHEEQESLSDRRDDALAAIWHSGAGIGWDEAEMILEAIIAGDIPHIAFSGTTTD